MGIEVIEVTVKCRVPLEDSEEYIVRLRSGEVKLGVPEGLICKDAFDCPDLVEPGTAIIQAGYRKDFTLQV